VPWWPHTAASAEQVHQRLTAAPFVAAANGTRAGRRRGIAKLLAWLSTFLGDTWLASGAEECPGAGWVVLPMRWSANHGGAASYDSTDLPSAPSPCPSSTPPDTPDNEPRPGHRSPAARSSPRPRTARHPPPPARQVPTDTTHHRYGQPRPVALLSLLLNTARIKTSRATHVQARRTS
jgi:hypothetical protein